MLSVSRFNWNPYYYKAIEIISIKFLLVLRPRPSQYILLRRYRIYYPSWWLTKKTTQFPILEEKTVKTKLEKNTFCTIPGPKLLTMDKLLAIQTGYLPHKAYQENHRTIARKYLWGGYLELWFRRAVITWLRSLGEFPQKGFEKLDS